jgi:hypothetical protein
MGHMPLSRSGVLAIYRWESTQQKMPSPTVFVGDCLRTYQKTFPRELVHRPLPITHAPTRDRYMATVPQLKYLPFIEYLIFSSA